ncbi:MAG: hypothetical protein AAGG08_18375 [Actinomycetota bacterium]
MSPDDPTVELPRPQRPSASAVGKRRCRWCRRVLPDRAGPGRPKQFCTQECRQWDWVHRQRAAELDLSEHELVIARDALDRLQDDLYVLACAIDDTERDLAAGLETPAELRRTLDWLLDAARSVATHQLTPATPRAATA